MTFMNIKLAAKNEVEQITMSAVYVATMTELMKDNRQVMQIEADLGMSLLGPAMFAMKKETPDQVLDCGIQENNMVGVAAGLSAVGKVPFAHSFAPFIARRCCDQIFISGCYAKANVRLVGSDPGIMAAFNGGTHMPFEDVGILRTFPGMTILEPSDSTMAENLLRQLVDLKGMYYIRYSRKNMVKLYETGSIFEIGKSNIVRHGAHVTIIAAGIMVAEALAASDLLKAEGITARVVDMFTLKPIDADMIIRCAKETGAIVTAENHNVIGGLGSAVAEVLAVNQAVPMEMVGVADQFGQVGPVDFLKEAYHLTAKDIAEKAKKAIARK